MTNHADNLRELGKLGDRLSDDESKNIERLRKIGEKLVDPEFAVQLFEDGYPDAIAVVDAEGLIKLVNKHLEMMFGYHRADLYDQPIETLIPEHCRDVHKQHRQGYTEEPRTRPMGLGMILQGRHRSGTTFDLEISLAPIMARQGYFTVATIRKRRPDAPRSG